MNIECLHEVIYTNIYNRLLKIVPNIELIESSGSSSPNGLMTLNLEILHREPDNFTISLSHFYKHHSGEMIPDPLLTVKVSAIYNVAEALTYQDMYSYISIYESNGKLVSDLERINLNKFLYDWLGDLIDKKYSIKS